MILVSTTALQVLAVGILVVLGCLYIIVGAYARAVGFRSSRLRYFAQADDHLRQEVEQSPKDVVLAGLFCGSAA